MKLISTIVLLLMLCTSQFVSAQISESLANEWAKFDFQAYIAKYKKIEKPTFEEKELTARVLYRMNEFYKALDLIVELENQAQLSENIAVLKKDIQHLLELQKGIDLFQLEEVDFNSEKAEFSCAFKNGRLYYSTNNVQELAVHRKDVQTNHSYLNVESREMNETSSVLLSNETFSDRNFNDGPVAFYGDLAAITLNYANEKNKNLRLIFSNQQGEKEFEYNDPSYSVGHATFSVTGDTLVFVSDLENKDGWTDLYYSVKEDNKWSQPVKLPQNINTFGNEMFPTLVGEVLYFSSNGHSGKGLLDIYKVNWLVKNAEPILLPYPFNSPYDDFGIVFTNNTSQGYLSSNRKGSDDIYYFDQSVINFDCISACKNDPCVQLEIEDFTAFDDSRYAFIWDFGDGKKGEGAYVTHCYQDTGEYFVQLSYQDKLTGKFLDGVMSDTIRVKTKVKNLPSFVLTDSLDINQKFKITDNSQLNSGDLTVSAWDVNGEILVVDFPEISFDQPGYKKIIRHVKVGDSACCYQTFYDYVYVSPNNFEDTINTQIESNNNYTDTVNDLHPIQIIVKDQSEKNIQDYQLILQSEDHIIFYDGPVKDTLTVWVDLSKEYQVSAITDKGELNKSKLSLAERTERDFLFIYQLENEGNYTLKTIDDKGNVLTDVLLLNGDSLVGKTNTLGYFSFSDLGANKTRFSKYLYFEETEDLTKMQVGDTLTVILVKMEVDAVFRLEDIYFDLNKWNIRSDAAEELDKLVAIMKQYPTLEIELRAHTDSRGSNAFNENLSDKRAKSAAAYIVAKGIDIDRLQGKGYGETLLLNECKDGVKCSSEQHQWNRRVECKILKI